jgi:rhodanese-related sulfurtransferase
MQCRSGVRSAKAADILAKSGFTNVHNMDGGLNAWQKANLKTIQAN